LVTVVVMVTLVPTATGDAGPALVATVVVPLPGVADAGDALNKAAPATIRTDAAPNDTTERNFL
jgi:hypothetical protein